MSRLVIASNRLPATLEVHDDTFSLKPSSGGLATAMRTVHGEGTSLWVGYVGDASRLSPEDNAALAVELDRRRLVPVPISASEVRLYYDGFSNGVLWPLFHYLIDKVRVNVTHEWREYQAVNRRFADAIAARLRPGDQVWIHDYQLALVPGYLRRSVENVRIGFFLHVPWPAADVYRILPHREEILEGLLGADLVGFHTEGYRQNFIYCAAKVLGAPMGVDAVRFEDRDVRVGVYPIGIDVGRFTRADEKVAAETSRIASRTLGKKRLLGVDRLDYTKGLPRRLNAIDLLLEHEPRLREQLHFIQLAVPTRENVDTYAKLRRTVNELVGRINAQHGSATGNPIQFMYRSVDDDSLLALYRSADVMIVTPLRDGMNLVAKEYVASRTDGDGVLVLSEFAGAASELDAAVIVNPYDNADLAAGIRSATMMDVDERRLRMGRLRKRVLSAPVDRWARDFLDDLGRAPVQRPATLTPPSELQALVGELASQPRRVLLIDYDGTLVPLARLPELARPDQDLLTLLEALATAEGNEVHIVSGRPRELLDEWLSKLPLWLHAEHGFWTCEPGRGWVARRAAPEFLVRGLEIMRSVEQQTPDTMVESKSSAIAFHYRNADPQIATVRVAALRAELARALGGAAEIIDGHKVLEVRLAGINKGSVVEDVLAHGGNASAVFAAGDDRTDEDMFAVLGPNALTVRVGHGNTRARFRVNTPADLRLLLARLVSPHTR